MGCSAILAAELLPLWASVEPEHRRPLPQLLHVGDGLNLTGWRAAVTVMNPLYGRVRLSAQDRERWDDSLFGHANRFVWVLDEPDKLFRLEELPAVGDS